MTVIRRVLRWIDWRSGVVVVASCAVALVGYVVIDSGRARDDAVSAAKRAVSAATASSDEATGARKAASRRIDLLNQRIEDLTALIAEGNRTQGILVGEVADLQEQVRQLGGKPVVISPPTTTPARPATTTTTAPSRPTTTTTTTPPPRRTCVAGICIGGTS